MPVESLYNLDVFSKQEMRLQKMVNDISHANASTEMTSFGLSRWSNMTYCNCLGRTSNRLVNVLDEDKSNNLKRARCWYYGEWYVIVLTRDFKQVIYVMTPADSFVILRMPY